MKPCTALRTSCSRAVSPSACSIGHCQRRWRSYNKTDLTQDALLEKLESGLGTDADGRPLKIDPESRTVSTAAGSLPISPLFDPAWLKARRRQQKDAPGATTGRFRKKLANNPYARALSEPVRLCMNTNAEVPRFFLQDFEVVKHPDTGKEWWAPGPLAFKYLYPKRHVPGETEENSTAVGDEGAVAEEGQSSDAEGSASEKPSAVVSQANTYEMEATTESEQENDELSADTIDSSWRPTRSPITGYTICRKGLVDSLDDTKNKALLIAMRSGMAVSEKSRATEWQPGTGDALLRMLRRRATDQLVERGTRVEDRGGQHKFVQACEDWAAVKDVMARGCVLWMPRDGDARAAAAAEAQFATLDVEGVAFGAKMAVHNLWWLLGEQEVERLREGAEVFRDREIVVLRQWRSVKMMKLHLLLWRLQGYLADSTPLIRADTPS